VAASQPSNTSKAEEDVTVEQVCKIWCERNADDLRVRFECGQLLNAQYGVPGKRQTYGAGVFQRLKDEAGLSPTAISQMRWFATMADDFDGFKTEHPELQTWSAVREFVKGLTKDHGTGDEVQPSSEKTKAAVKGILRSLDRAAEYVAQVKLEDVGDQADKLQKAMKKFVQLAKDLGLSIAPPETAA
jgi:hypothetical protein